MVASPSKKIKTAEDIIAIIENLPELPVYTNDDTGEHFRLGQVISSPFNPNDFVYDGSSISTKLNSLLEIAEDVIDDDRYYVDYDLRRKMDDPDYQFLSRTVARHGERV